LKQAPAPRPIKEKKLQQLVSKDMEKIFFKNSLEKNLFTLLFLNAQDQEPKP
jgi:hypothetical protein